MTEEQILAIWDIFKEYIDKKSIDIVAKKYVEELYEFGVPELTLTSLLEHDQNLDVALSEYLEIDSDGDDDDDLYGDE